MKSNSKITEEASNIKLDERSIPLRSLVLQALVGAGRSHVGSALSLVEIIRVVYDNLLI
jgi:transketolase